MTVARVDGPSDRVSADIPPAATMSADTRVGINENKLELCSRCVPDRQTDSARQACIRESCSSYGLRDSSLATGDTDNIDYHHQLPGPLTNPTC